MLGSSGLLLTFPPNFFLAFSPRIWPLISSQLSQLAPYPLPLRERVPSARLRVRGFEIAQLAERPPHPAPPGLALLARGRDPLPQGERVTECAARSSRDLPRRNLLACFWVFGIL